MLHSVNSDLTSPMVFKNDRSLELRVEISIFGSLMLDLATFNTHVEFVNNYAVKKTEKPAFPHL